MGQLIRFGPRPHKPKPKAPFWSTVERYVLNADGTRYHKPSCRHASKDPEDLTPMPLIERYGAKPCKSCFQ